MSRFPAALLLALLCSGSSAKAQDTASPTPPAAATPTPPPQDTTAKTAALTPSEAYRYAMQPFVDARSAPNDLTEADQWALGLGASRAHEQCEALAPAKAEGEDLLALGRLCVFGQDLGPAEHALTTYLGMPKMENEKSARLLMTRIFVQLQSITSAESQLESLTAAFPYDADIHWAIDQVIDAAEADTATLSKENSEDDQTIGIPGEGSRTVGILNDLQLPFILKALAGGGTLKTSDSTVDAAVLTRDGLRCADAMRQAGKKNEAAGLVEQLKTLTLAPAIMQSASEPGIESAFARYLLKGQPAPIQELRGTLVTKAPAQATRRFAAKTIVLVAFSLGAPQSRDAIARLVTGLGSAASKQPVQLIAVTSYAAMDGIDEPSEAVLKTLQVLQLTLPASVPMMIVPNADLKAFAIDAFPAAVVIRPSGKIAYLNLFPGSAGSVQLVIRAATETAPIETSK